MSLQKKCRQLSKCSNFAFLKFNPFGDATFNIDLRMLPLWLCYSMRLLTIFQVVF